MAGRSRIKITVDVYGHLVPGANRQAVNRLPSLDAFSAADYQIRKGLLLPSVLGTPQDLRPIFANNARAADGRVGG